MTLDIFKDISTGIEHLFKDFGNFVEKNFDNPIFWILLISALLIIGYFAIHALNDK